CTNRPDIRSKPTKSFKMSKSACHQRPSTYDDWGPEPLTADQRRDLLEIVDDRYDKGSLLITSQVPVSQWHDVIADPTLGDAILDRIIHNAHRIELKGDSLRRQAGEKKKP
ncbi:ATP-binding protein, partial [Bradyrhizobium sp. 177]